MTDDSGKERTSLYGFEIVQADTPFLHKCLRLFYDWRRFKVLPHGGGTLDERQTVIDILTLLDSEANQFDSWEMEQNKQKNAASRPVARRPPSGRSHRRR